MKDPRLLSIQQFSYTLPEERIAKFPLENREDSKLLVYSNGRIQDDHYRHISSHLTSKSLLVFNDTRVVAARLIFRKSTGGLIEIFCLGPADPEMDVAVAMQQKHRVEWQCLVGGASKWKPGQTLSMSVDGIELRAKYKEKLPESFRIELSWSPQDLSFAELLQQLGTIPLPPYIKRKTEPSDRLRYQTVYARAEGSVAAPTAGLHFSSEVMKQLEQKKIDTAFVTLHVGAGTFKPVKTGNIGDHQMHFEWMDVGIDLIRKLRNDPGRSVIAIGTTSLRTLESLYWIGRRFALNPQQELFPVSQWEPYEEDVEKISRPEALEALLRWMDSRHMERLVSQTGILIGPGYTFRITEGLVTNFHQPRSTLLLLIAAFIGDDWHRVYEHAMEHGYRFLSYGDGSLLMRPESS
jgi:S-adenosylmethionine:tRNA ribosyltransferase-isomerase